LKAYIEEHVPKFILIDRQGNVVNFMAPKPSKGEELEKLIMQELKKH
jgi:cytochrome oxidase Cu insertion factor (SCO1/SenC/PrrC family)